jgi:glutamyl-queuosine tRNA(Asp) synthetase
VGNLRTALASWLSVKARGGRWHVRMEDVDKARSRSSVAEQQLRDLAALGLESDGTVLWQSQRDNAYQQALERLHAQGLLYPCACTRKDLALMSGAPQESDGLRPYAGRCRGRKLEKVRPEALRFHLPEGCVEWMDVLLGRQCDDPRELTGDPLLHRRDGCYAYHLAVVVDDGEQGINEVVRGGDLRSVTATQIRLQEALAWPRPAYAHLGLVTAPDGTRLGKREGSVGLRALEAKSIAVSQFIGWLGWSLGCLEQPEPCAATDLIPRFRWDRVPKGDLVVPHRWME